MTTTVGEYSFIITPDLRCRVYHKGKFKWKSLPCESRANAEKAAQNFIETIQKGEITLDVQNLITDPDTFLGGNYGKILT